MTLSTARVILITLTLLVVLSWLTFIKFNGVVKGGDPVPGLPCEIPAICEPRRGDEPGARPAVR